RIVNAAGIENPCAVAEAMEGGVRVTGRGDGRFYLRAVCNNGAAHARVISQLELEARGFGSAFLDPYGFIAGGLYGFSEGEITPGNDKGIAFARDGRSMAGFSNVDFGPVGSDEITIPVFALDGSAYEIALYRGDPRKGGELLAKLPYQKPCIWNTYQPDTWKLPARLTGVQTLCFVMDRKIHLKGFSFARLSRAWLALRAGEADAVYGDSFVRDDGAVRDIGNNVSLVFGGMDFESGGRARLNISGHTPLAANPIQVRIVDARGEIAVQECLFRGGAPGEQQFELAVPTGVCTVTFVFLPGCRFDFESFRFETF
ncbi:MAG: glycoside hydrolase family 2, partial [Clostridia bacterium]|nr:glycoside hydrolase family 2 [Clostridia bacterium]